MNKNRLFLSLLMLVSFSQIYSQDYMNKKVRFLLDCWKYNFGWKTLGGGYIRHILLFTDSHLVDIETTQVSNTPGYSNGSYITESESSFSDVAINIVGGIFLEQLFKKFHDPQKEMEQQIKSVIEQASSEPTVGNYFNAISYIFLQKGIKSKIVAKMSYEDLKNMQVKVKNEQVVLSFQYGKTKYKYISHFGNNSYIVKNVLDNILIKKRIDNIEVYTNKQDTNEPSKTGFYLELLGQGIGLSFNADFRFKEVFSFRIGYSFAIFAAGMNTSFYYLKNIKNNHNIEIGAGVNFFEVAPLFSGRTTFLLIPTLAFGYRYQPKNGGLIFRTTITPLFLFDKELQYDFRSGESKEVYKVKTAISGGISFGYCF